MSRKSSMKNGQPTKYWAVRNAVSVGQLCITAAVIGGISWWLAVDGNGSRLWGAYYGFSQQASEWAKEDLSYPWEGLGGANDAEVAQEDTELEWLVGEYCEADARTVLEGETERFQIVICEGPDGDLSYVGWNEELGGITLPADDAGGHWTAENDVFQYRVDTDSLMVFEAGEGADPVIEEDLLWSETY